MPRRELTTIDEVLDKLGGVPGVAVILGRSTQNICNFRRRRHFPAVVYPKIERRLNRRGFKAALSLFRFEVDDDDVEQKRAA
jgi:hypothetical protein